MTREPFNMEAERAVLGAILLEPASIEAAAAILDKTDFSAANQPIYGRALELFQGGNIVDSVLLVNALRQHGELEAAGGPAYVCALTDGMVSGANVRAYAELVRQAASRRRTIEAIKNAVHEVGAGNGDHGALIDRLIGELEKIDRPKSQAFTPPAHWSLLDVSEAHSWQCESLEWLVEDIFAKGTLAFVAADSQAGKSLLMLHAALMIARGNKLFDRFNVNAAESVLYLALEDPARRIKRRVIDTDRFGNLTPPGKFKVYIAPGLRLNDVLCMAWLEQFIECGKHDVVIIDTFQKGTPGLVSWDDEKISPIMHALQDLARRLNILIVIIDHLAKPKDGKKRKAIQITDIKGTGGKAQNADTVMLIDRVKADTIAVHISCKDSDKKLAFLLRISPECERNEAKFIYEGDLDAAAGQARNKGQETRQQILNAVPESWATTDEIAAKVDRSRSTVREHLKILVDKGQIEADGENRARKYRRINRRNETTQTGETVNSISATEYIADDESGQLSMSDSLDRPGGVI